MHKKAAIHNLGCKVNAYEASAMEETLKQAGYKMVPFEQKADVYVINTCTVTAVAGKKSRQMIRRARTLNPDAVVVACGCYVQKEADQVSDVCDIILGTDNKGRILEKIEEFLKGKGEDNHRESIVDLSGEDMEYEPLSISSAQDRTRAYVKIQDGCNSFCSYCIIPYVRGRSRSRSPKDIIEECKRLVSEGYKEVVLCAINLSDYRYENEGLLDLILKINDVEGISRIRLGSLEPDFFTEEFVLGIKSAKKVCPHFHFSLQSASDNTLKAMGRRYTFDSVLEGVKNLRSAYGDCAIWADVIAGFPQESEEDFSECLNNIKKIGLSKLHVFPYSKREGTRAAKLPQLSRGVKKSRADRLLTLSKEISREYKKDFIGKRVEILIEEKAERDEYIQGDFWLGFTSEYVKCLLEDEGFERGSIVSAKALEFKGDYLYCKAFSPC